jgi:hypothetical protein
MANVIGSYEKKFSDRGYVYQKPTVKECKEMGWTGVRSGIWRGMAENELITWCRQNIWWQDYVLDYGMAYFKYPKDATLFALRWA